MKPACPRSGSNRPRFGFSLGPVLLIGRLPFVAIVEQDREEADDEHAQGSHARDDLTIHGARLERRGRGLLKRCSFIFPSAPEPGELEPFHETGVRRSFLSVRSLPVLSPATIVSSPMD